MTDRPSAKTPYYRLSDDEYASYLQEGLDLLEKIAGRRLEDTLITDGAEWNAYFVGSARIYPNDLLANCKSIFFNLEHAQSVVEAYKEKTNHIDGKTEREKVFGSVAYQTNSWRDNNVGPLRAAYFYHALTFPLPAQNPDRSHDPMKCGGFPPAVDQSFGAHCIKCRGGHDILGRLKDWLAYDAYLTQILAWFQISWLDLEDALLKAFISALPKKYQHWLKEQNIPEPLIPILWRHDLEHLSHVKMSGEKPFVLTAKLYEELIKIGYDETVIQAIHHLRNALQPSALTTFGGKPLSDFDKYLKIKPLPRKAFYNALADSLLDLIERRVREVNSSTFPDSLKKIHRSVEVGSKENPTEFWKLCADVVHHLPILILGLPRRGGLTAFPSCDALRLIYVGSKRYKMSDE